jgi:hypothetical protein
MKIFKTANYNKTSQFSEEVIPNEIPKSREDTYQEYIDSGQINTIEILPLADQQKTIEVLQQIIADMATGNFPERVFKDENGKTIAWTGVDYRGDNSPFDTPEQLGENDTVI